jgi:AcrR family transcriptional regulator
MPKSFSEQERKYIKEKLKTESKLLFSQYGIKKTTIDEIVKRANIPKGTFYLFYDSKEMLLFDIIMEEQETIHNELNNAVSDLGQKLTKEVFSELVFNLFKRTTESFLFPIFTGGEYELLLRKFPREALEQNVREDNESMEKLFALIPQAAGKDINIYSGALRGVALLTLHKNEIGEDIFDDAMRIIINGITDELFKI